MRGDRKGGGDKEKEKYRGKESDLDKGIIFFF